MKRMVKSEQDIYELELPEVTFDEAWDTLRTYGAEEQTLRVITNINGNSVDTLNDVCRCLNGCDLTDLIMGIE